MLDLTEPVAIILVAVLHFLTDADDPSRIAAALRDAAPPGSYLVVSHVTAGTNAALTGAATRLYNDKTADGKARSRYEIARFFGDWELAAPGLVYAPLWRPDPSDEMPAAAERMWFLAGVAQKPVPACG